MSLQRRLWLLLLTIFIAVGIAHSDSAFDLDGPQIHVKVTRGATTLPIARVPSLQANDQIWLQPEMPPGQSVHYLIVVAFLRGSTNPPPDSWFTKAEAWNKSVRNDGIRITVPDGAEHVLILMAPETGGGFTTIRSAVQSDPGVFVRATVDLNQASLDRSRVDTYLNAVKLISNTDPTELEAQTKLLARSLDLKIDAECFRKPANQQPSCLTKDSSSLVLNDSHTESVVAALSSGDAASIFNQVSTTSIGGGGVYSPYVGAIVDVVHLMGTLHTADYQYIPALSLVKDDLISLKLNSPPSFHKPKSVLVVGMPAVQSAQFPPLRAVNEKQVYCMQSPTLMLPVEGAPLVFSTGYAHGMVLQIDSTPIEIAAVANPMRGGYVMENPAANAALPQNDVIGRLNGSWGFDAFQGPTFHLQKAHPAQWMVVSADKDALFVGRKDTLEIQSNAASCVHQVTMNDAEKKPLPVTWKLVKPDTLQVQVAMEHASPGTVTLDVQQYGLQKPDQTKLHAYAEAATLGTFTLHSGDTDAVLEGTRLDEVVSVELKGIQLIPSKLTHQGATDELHLILPEIAGKDAVKANAKEADTLAALKQGEAVVLHVTLKDGRVLNLPQTILPSRPRVTVISKTVQMTPSSTQSGVQFANQDDLPQNGRLSFFLQSVVPSYFPRTEDIEVAAVDGSFHTILTVANGTLVLQDAQTVLAELDPIKSFGASAFGALQFRPITADGVTGNWQPLASLVRLPSLQQVRCPMDVHRQCTLNGSDLFLLDSIASDSQFRHAVSVPIGFAGSTLSVPRPNGTVLYIKLRDDPKSVNMIALPVLPELP